MAAATAYHPPPPAPSNATVTALAYRRAAPGGGRHPVPHKTGSRRRHLESGFEVQGNLFSLGYFSANVCFGTPGQRFDLIIDTGSSLTAMPCQGCSHCGSHSHEASGGLPAYSRARFDGAAPAFASEQQVAAELHAAVAAVLDVGATAAAMAERVALNPNFILKSDLVTAEAHVDRDDGHADVDRDVTAMMDFV